MQTSRQGLAAITGLTATASGVSVTASGDYEAGIGRVDFVLVDLSGNPPENVVDRQDIDYTAAPTHVAEAWTASVALRPTVPYRLFFHLYDRTGVNLVAYDRRDFTCQSNETQGD